MALDAVGNRLGNNVPAETARTRSNCAKRPVVTGPAHRWRDLGAGGRKPMGVRVPPPASTERAGGRLGWSAYRRPPQTTTRDEHERRLGRVLDGLGQDENHGASTGGPASELGKGTEGLGGRVFSPGPAGRLVRQSPIGIVRRRRRRYQATALGRPRRPLRWKAGASRGAGRRVRFVQLGSVRCLPRDARSGGYTVARPPPPSSDGDRAGQAGRGLRIVRRQVDRRVLCAVIASDHNQPNKGEP
jgi:hypothetical protein